MNLKEQILQKINNKTKPIGALGMLENIALQIGEIQQTLTPQIAQPIIVVFAADHGIASTGLVNPYPQSVTAQMVLNFLHGGAAINVFCKQNNIQLIVVDAGVNHDFIDLVEHDSFFNAKQAFGTKNYQIDQAMTSIELNESIEYGRSTIKKLKQGGCNCVGLGEMGIGNTSSASLIQSVLCEIPLADCVGNGTGVNKDQFLTKLNTLEAVYAHHQLKRFVTEPLQLIAHIGGFEIAMMVGAYLQSVEENLIIVVDGYISTAALLVAYALNPQVIKNCIFAHTSGEKGHEKMLTHLGVTPILNLGMRLGEGTGCALAIPLLQSSVAFLNEMASFESAGVDQAL
jgi:nicotinate-nucleotide--dimethylbenzimidazole phosphoribosyltransferase